MSTIHAPLTGMALPAFANKERLKKVTNDKHVPEPERVQRCVRVVLDVRHAKTIRYGYDPRKAQFKQAPKQVLKPAVKFTHADNEIRHKWLLLTFFCLFFFLICHFQAVAVYVRQMAALPLPRNEAVTTASRTSRNEGSREATRCLAR